MEIMLSIFALLCDDIVTCRSLHGVSPYVAVSSA